MQKRRVFPLRWSELKRLTESYGNPVSFLHGLSRDARDALRSAASLLAQGEPHADRLIFLECIGAEAAQTHTAEWADLAERALEPNIFYEPGFALNAARHIPNSAKPDFLFCWETGVAEVRGRLLGVWPLLLPRSGFPGLARSWSHDYGCSCAPLLDRAAARLVLERMLLWVWQTHRHLSAVATPQLLANNPACAAMSEHARRFGLAFDLVERYDRAALDATLAADGARDFVSAKKRKELQRQLRRLRDLGSVAFHETDGDDLHEQIEAFMRLEDRGWKGRKGAAFLKDAGLATFLRAMGRTLGREGKCRIYWLSLDQKMIAGNVVLLNAQGGAYFWKTAYDEDYGFASPGVLLTMDMTDRLLKDKRVLHVDSCAVADHPMIDRLWRGRTRVCEVMLANAPDRSVAFSALLYRERFFRFLKKKSKSALAQIKSALAQIRDR